MSGCNKAVRWIVGCAALTAAVAAGTTAWSKTPERPPAQMTWLDNGRIRLGLDLSIGGAITWLSEAGGPNLINSFDWGRQVQMSFYSGPVPFVPPGATVSPHWKKLGWNPIQSGDCYGHRSRVVEHRNDGQAIYVRCVPMQWPLENVPGECEFECWFRLEGATVQVRSRLNNHRADHTQYPARDQELPAVYTNGPWYRLVSYLGDKPFTGAAPTVLVDRDDGKGWPWLRFYSPERWAALLDKNDRGLGIYHPDACEFSGGFSGKKGAGGPGDAPTGYMTPLHKEILDHNIAYSYEYALVVGSLKEIRDYVRSRHDKNVLPEWRFTSDRQHWLCRNTTDAGWPVRDGLVVTLGLKDAALVGPKTSWQAEAAPKLYLRAAFTTDAALASVTFKRFDATDAAAWPAWGGTKRPPAGPATAVPFDLRGDGQVRTLVINLSAQKDYRGAMTQLSLLLPPGKGTARIYSIGFRPPPESVVSPQRAALRRMQADCDYPAIARAYADFMLEHGRDTYGKVHSPLFVSVMDRKTGTVFANRKQVPYPHVITRPYAPGLRRDHKVRPQDRTYSGGNPIEDLPLYRLLYRLSDVSGEKRYAAEADKSIAWFLAHAQNPATGLFAWGSHMYWDVHQDLPVYASTGSPKGGYGGHEYNYVWPYWEQNPEALRRFAHGLWKNQIADQNGGRFSRHADYAKRKVGTGFEFPQTGSCYMDIWAREFARSGEADMKRAIQTLLGLYRSMRDPKTGAMAWCTAEGADRREVANIPMNLGMATTLQDAAALVEPRDKELAGQMRAFAREIDDEYLSNDYGKILDVAGKGILAWYTLAERVCMAKGLTPPPKGFDGSVGYPLRTSDGKPAASLYYLAPWFTNRSYAAFALLLADRYDRSEEKHKPLYRRAILETADIYMTIEPEVQFVLYPDDVADVVKLLRGAHRITGNPALLHRADRMMKLGVRLFFDDASPLPKISNFDDWYESSTKNGSSVEILRQMLDLSRDLAALPPENRSAPEIRPDTKWTAPQCLAAGNGSPAAFAAAFQEASAAGLAGAWNGTGLARPARDVVLRYGSRQGQSLYLSESEGEFTADGLRGRSWDIGISDAINKLPTAAEADQFNGRMKGFTGKGFTEAHIADAGFKDVVRQLALVIRNTGTAPAVVGVTATLHDAYHDNGAETCQRRLAAGEQGLFVLAAPSGKWLRRVKISSDHHQTALRLEQFALIMAIRQIAHIQK